MVRGDDVSLSLVLKCVCKYSICTVYTVRRSRSRSRSRRDV
jgi:hypothetical protein